MTTPQITNYTSTSQRTPSSTLGKQDFLNLLIMQMRHQDPLDPMKGTEFAAQLAQFSSLEQLTNLNQSMNNSLDANAMLTQSINNALSTTFIGKTVRAAADEFRYNGDGDVKIGYNLEMDAEKVDVKVFDDSGNLVKTFRGDLSKGENTLTWDGKNENGETVPVGKYHFQVEAKDSSNNSIETTKYIYGTVKGVRFKSEGTVFVIDGIEVALSSIVEITEGLPMSNTIVNGVNVPFLPVEGVNPKPLRPPVELPQEKSFKTIFEKELQELKFSKHAQQRLESRKMELNDSDKSKLENAVSRAEQKGSNDSLVFLRDMAFIVNVKNRTVITAIDRDNIRENVFTNIDSAVVAG